MTESQALKSIASKSGAIKKAIQKATSSPASLNKAVTTVKKAAYSNKKSKPKTTTTTTTTTEGINPDYAQDENGKWYIKSTGEPLGTGGTNAEWHEVQGIVHSKSENGGTGGTSTNYGTYKSDLDRLTKAQRQAQVDQLKAARTKALANLDAQEQQIKPMYQNARNLTSASSQQGARNFAEYLANRGLTNSGASAQGEINRLSTLQNNLGNINTQEANAYRDIANQRTAIENDYVAGLANANNALTNNYYNNLLNYNEQQRQYVQGLQNQALGQYANDYQAQIDNLLAQGYSPNSMEVLQLQALRGNKSNNLYNSGLANAQANILAGNINYNNAAALGMTVPQAQAYYQNYVAQQQAVAQAEQEALARQIAQQNYENELDYYNYLLNQQKVANDTAQTQYNVNKPYNSTVYHVSNGGSGGSGSNNKDSAIRSLAVLQKEDGTPLYSDTEIANIVNSIYG